jgi:hypothetical protein
MSENAKYGKSWFICSLAISKHTRASRISKFQICMCVYVFDEIIQDYQCVFWLNRLVTDQIFYIWQMLLKKWSVMVQGISYL